MKPGDTVEVTNGHYLTVPKFARGIILELDYERSTAGYCVFVEWSDKQSLNGHRRRTWIPETAIKVVT